MNFAVDDSVTLESVESWEMKDRIYWRWGTTPCSKATKAPQISPAELHTYFALCEQRTRRWLSSSEFKLWRALDHKIRCWKDEED
jgi:hypothetical protein